MMPKLNIWRICDFVEFCYVEHDPYDERDEEQTWYDEYFHIYGKCQANRK
jgi:hypothetical protein